MENITICSPETYETLQKKIRISCSMQDRQWIYHIINNDAKNEEIVHDTKDWIVCIDKHQGSDVRYLIIFKDNALKTIRDLNQSHLPMLREVQTWCQDFLVKHWGHKHAYQIFFHYLPSVFQLHLHLSKSNSWIAQNHRRHPLHTIIRNIGCDSTHYAKALILIPVSRFVRNMTEYNPSKKNVCLPDPSVWT